MNRGTESRKPLRRRSGVALLTLYLLTAPAASAAPPASDEYRLDLQGAQVTAPTVVGRTGESEGSSAGPQAGVSGERVEQPSPLGATGATISGAPVAAVAAALGLGWVLMSARPRFRRTP